MKANPVFLHLPLWVVLVLVLLPAAPAFAATSSLIATGSVWRYLADGSDQDTAWRAPAFNDAGWSNGAAALGFGDPVTTTIMPASNGIITFYFRHTFVDPGTNAYTQVQARLRRDDGAVVYLNGTELFRQNMPAGPVTFLTRAAGTVSAADETTYFATNVPAALGLLSPGLNTVAVELHQVTNSSSDISFDLGLTAITDTMPPSVTLTNPSPGATFIAGDNIALAAEAADDTGVARVQFYADGALVGTDTTAPYTATFGNVRIGSHALVAVAEDVGGLRATSATVNVTVTLDPTRVTLIANGAHWRYWDQGGDLGTEWSDPGFEDYEWPCGPAELGYGDGDEATVVSFGTNASNRYITTYFRRAFFAPDPGAYSNLVLRVRRDDGVAVYINGLEVFRNNLPAGALTAGTLATNAADDGATWIIANLSPAVLSQFENTIAAEIHQTTTNSSDISFDLQLLADVGPPAAPALRIDRLDPLAVLSWPASASAFVLQRAAVLGAGWINDPAPVVETNGFRQVTINLNQPQQFFQLAAPASAATSCQPVLVISQPLLVTAAPGANVTLTVTLGGDAPFSATWRKNGLNVPGGTGLSLTLTNVSREDGGSYDALVGNDCSCAFSCPIRLIVGGTNAGLSDSFADRGTLTNSLFELNVTNTVAGFETGEPANPSRFYGRTLWARWIAPGNGYATFDTRGSGQETALAVYSGTDLTNLVLEASSGPDDASRNSRVIFNVAAGEEFQIQLDSPAPVLGLCLNGQFTASMLPVPQIVRQPQSFYAQVGSNALLTVEFDGPSGALQWFKNGAVLTNATNATLAFTPLQPGDGGKYFLKSSSSISVTSGPASVAFVTVTGPGSGSVSPLLGQFGGALFCSGKKFTNHLSFHFRVLSDPGTAGCPLICSANGSQITDSSMQPCVLDVNGLATPVVINAPACAVSQPKGAATFHTVDPLNSTTSGASIDTGLLIFRMRKSGTNVCAYSCNYTCGTDNLGSSRWASNYVNFGDCTVTQPSTPIIYLKVFLLFNQPAAGTGPSSIKMHYNYCQ